MAKLKTVGTPALAAEYGPWAQSAWCIAAAFGTYFCVYLFRKPFSASTYDGADISIWGCQIGYKMLLVNAQVIGYTLSKFLGIKIIAELPPQRRIAGIVLLIAMAQAALLLFAVVPSPYNAICLFMNGLALGMTFGVVLAFLEGRRMTDLMMAALCASFILADGAAKSLGTYLLRWGVPDAWMPCVAGLIALAPMTIFVGMLTRVRAPSQADVALRSKRLPMNARQRWRFFWKYALGLSALLTMYTLITVLRSIRADYAPEIWSGLLGQKLKAPPAVFTTSETFVALAVMVANGLCFLIRDSRKAFYTALSIGAGGTLLICLSVVALRNGMLGGFAFMVLTGIGLYLPYVAIHTTIFERLIAITRDRGNLGYLMYLADAFGYLGYPIFLMLIRTFIPKPDFLQLFSTTAICLAIASLASIIVAGMYFRGMQPGMASETEIPAIAALEET
jgi:hypothetical protein